MSENKKLIPKRRFKEFQNTDAWEQRELGEVLDFSITTNSLSRNMLNYDVGELRSVHYGDILVNYESILNVNTDKIPFVTGGKVKDFISQLLQNGDIVFADAAEDETVGKAVEINGLANGNLVAGLHTIVGRPLNKFADRYLGYYINSDSYHRQLIPLMQGTKVSSISKSTLQKTKIIYPNMISEQKSIGTFFSNLDQTIAFQQRKLEKMKSMKSAYLSEMFPAEGERKPKRRFPGFTDDWEQRELIKMLSEPITDGPHETPPLVEKGIPFISVDAIIDNKIDFNRRRGFITEKMDEIYSKKYKPKYHDVYLVKSGSTVGKTAIVDTNIRFNIWSPLAAMRTGNMSDPYFLYFLLQTNTLQNQVRDKASNGTQPNVGMRDLEKFDVVIPSVEEQKQIGSFFQNLDQTIAFQQQKLEKLQNIKKAYLNEMFI